ncbi:MAG: hypothetical protein DDT30_01404 [Dehalococcoidia bacterium]|nr:hypothetical protein [Bacillota bacterium]MBT9141896.1 hypothetical protein [Bacillota bacterium]
MALTAAEAVDRAKKQLSDLTEKQPSSVTAVSKDEKGWHILLEMLERKAIPDRMDLLASYDVLLDEEGNMVKFDRGGLRTRGDATKYE